jgi:uncharacterized protein GlcG (DUF336 family)
MKLIEALSGHTQTSAERRSEGGAVRVTRRQAGYALTHTVLDHAGHPLAQTWQFQSLYELFQFARQRGLTAVDLEATDWEVVPEQSERKT